MRRYPDGTPMPEDLFEYLAAWTRVARDEANWVVGSDPVGRYRLSTIWVGESGGTFETALFDGDELVDVLYRWKSWYNALWAHLILLTALQLGNALPRWPAPQDLYDVAQQVTDDVLGAGSWQDPRRLFATVRECVECGSPVLVRWTESGTRPQSCAEHS